MKTRLRTKTRNRSESLPALVLITGLALMAVLILFVGMARAQISYPRVGLSASPHEYIDTIDVAEGE